MIGSQLLWPIRCSFPSSTAPFGKSSYQYIPCDEDDEPGAPELNPPLSGPSSLSRVVASSREREVEMVAAAAVAALG
jgi:hypothetical protein